MFSFAKLLRIRQGIGKKYKNMGLENFLLSISNFFRVKVMMWPGDCSIVDPIFFFLLKLFFRLPKSVRGPNLN
jgi:hypothetical protein